MKESAVFTADPEGFREQNAGRPAAHLIREAVQNVFDEAATQLDVELRWLADTGAIFRIVDNVPGGIRDERLIWTIWMSDKVDSPQKRGRMGRGLKELISVSDWTLITTAGGPATEFTRERGKWRRESPRKRRPEAGTIVEGRVKMWRRKDVDAACEYLSRMRPPSKLAFTVNGKRVYGNAAVETYDLKLPTVLFEVDGDSRVERNPRRETMVELVFDGEQSWIYEMGIPIETIDFPLSIDVGQRIPLREKRDTLTEPYRRELFAKLLDARLAAGKVLPAQLKDDHVMIASHAPEHLSAATKEAIAEAWTGGRAYATTPATTRAATGMHLPVVPLRALPESVREIVREVGKDAKNVIAEMGIASTSLIHESDADFRPEHTKFIIIWEWIAKGIDRPCTVYLARGRPSAGASFNRESRVLTFYVENNPRQIIDEPLSREALAILIHELAHWRPQDEDAHGFDFHSDAEQVGGAVAAFLYEYGGMRP